MNKIIFTILLTIFSCLNLFAQFKITKEDYEIYATIFEENYKNFKPNQFAVNLAVLQNTVETEFFEQILNDKRSLEHFYSTLSSPNVTQPVLNELIENFGKINKESVKLEKMFPVKYEYNLITKSEIEMLLEEGRKEIAESFKKCVPCADKPDCTMKSGLCRTDEKCSRCIISLYPWMPFLKKYRNSEGYYSLSRIAFSADKKNALVHVRKYRGDRLDLGFYALNKIDGVWKIDRALRGGWVK